MAYEMYIYDKSSFSSGFSNLFEGWGSESGSGSNGKTLTTSGNLSGIKVEINDNNGSFHDDPNYMWGGSQKLAQAITINGVTYPAGSNIEMGFVADIQDSDGNVSRFYSIKINNNIVGVSVLDPNSPAAGIYAQPVTAGISTNTTYTVFDTDNGNGGGTTTPYSMLIPCFTAGTMIETDRGAVAIETLQVGDLVRTKDHGMQPIRWIGSRTLDAIDLAHQPSMRPIRIAKGALGEALPAQDLLVSPQHRMLISSRIAQRIFGAQEVLVAAKQLVLIDGIDVAPELSEVTYIHLMFDCHEIVTANGAASESLYAGAEALKSIGAAAAAELEALFPELATEGYQPEAARLIASGRQGRRLAMRHKMNHRSLVS